MEDPAQTTLITTSRVGSPTSARATTLIMTLLYAKGRLTIPDTLAGIVLYRRAPGRPLCRSSVHEIHSSGPARRSRPARRGKAEADEDEIDDDLVGSGGTAPSEFTFVMDLHGGSTAPMDTGSGCPTVSKMQLALAKRLIENGVFQLTVTQGSVDWFLARSLAISSTSVDLPFAKPRHSVSMQPSDIDTFAPETLPPTLPGMQEPEEPEDGGEDETGGARMPPMTLRVLLVCSCPRWFMKPLSHTLKARFQLGRIGEEQALNQPACWLEKHGVADKDASCVHSIGMPARKDKPWYVASVDGLVVYHVDG